MAIDKISHSYKPVGQGNIEIAVADSYRLNRCSSSLKRGQLVTLVGVERNKAPLHRALTLRTPFAHLLSGKSYWLYYYILEIE